MPSHCDSDSATIGVEESENGVTIEEWENVIENPERANVVMFEHLDMPSTSNSMAITDDADASDWTSWTPEALKRPKSSKLITLTACKGAPFEKGVNNRHLQEKYAAVAEVRLEESRQRMKREQEEYEERRRIAEEDRQERRRHAEEERQERRRHAEEDRQERKRNEEEDRQRELQHQNKKHALEIAILEQELKKHFQ